MNNMFTNEVNEKIKKLVIYKHANTLNDMVQTEELCLKLVKLDCRVLEYIKEQTEEICLEAVKQNGDILEYVKNQTEEICLEAVKEDGRALKYVKNQTEEMCLLAINEPLGSWVGEDYSDELDMVNEEFKPICIQAIKNHEHLLEYVNNLDVEECIRIIEEI